MRTLKRITALALAVLLLPLHLYAAEDSVFIRIDRDDPDAWKEELANVRFLEDEGISTAAIILNLGSTPLRSWASIAAFPSILD